MQRANEYQIGGGHYKIEYQHWDFVCDTGMHYLLGCATKYVSRWKDKNGKQDLQKAIHYLNKSIEKDIKIDLNHNIASMTLRFCTQLERKESSIVFLIVDGCYNTAIGRITSLLEMEQHEE